MQKQEPCDDPLKKFLKCTAFSGKSRPRTFLLSPFPIPWLNLLSLLRSPSLQLRVETEREEQRHREKRRGGQKKRDFDL